MTESKAETRLAQLIAEGFDRSWITEDETIRVACSQCEVLVINGLATHETECPNAVSEPDDDDDEIDYWGEVDRAEIRSLDESDGE